MNILIDLSFIRTNLHQGVSKYAYRFLDFIVEEELTNEFTLLLNTVSQERLSSMYPQFKYITIGPSIYKNIPILRTIWTSRAFRTTINLSDYELIFCPWANEISCLKTNKKVISVIHDLQYLKDKKGLELRLFKTIYNLIIKNSHSIVTISEYSKSDILTYYPDIKSKVHVLGNSVSTCLKIDKTLINEPYILFVGRICELKNIITLIKAFIILKKDINQKLVIVGEKNTYWNEIVYPLITKSGIENRIILISNCTEEELTSLYKNADLFVFPSLREGFGSPPLEAAILKTPVIVSQCESLPEVTLGLLHTYNNTTDENELADKILSTIRNPDSDEKLDSISKEIYLNYNIKTIGNRIYNFLNKNL